MTDAKQYMQNPNKYVVVLCFALTELNTCYVIYAHICIRAISLLCVSYISTGLTYTNVLSNKITVEYKSHIAFHFNSERYTLISNCHRCPSIVRSQTRTNIEMNTHIYFRYFFQSYIKIIFRIAFANIMRFFQNYHRKSSYCTA
jgi:hypothetical protein